MEKFITIKSKAMPIALQDIDTDQILPAQFLTSVSRDGYGQNLFRGMRDKDTNFAINRPEFAGAGVLVADNNFGCGSSREHAVWAITGGGFKVVISKSFADIFSSNSAKNGLLLVTLPDEVVDRMLVEAESGNYEVEVNLESQTVTLPSGEQHSFTYDSFRKHCLLNGLDDIDYIRSHQDKIEAFIAKRAPVRFASSANVGKQA